MFNKASRLNPNVLRIARITGVHRDKGTVEIAYIDAPPLRSKQIEVPMPVPYASSGWGILVGPDTDTWVIVGKSYNDKPYILGTIATSPFFSSSLGEIQEARYSSYPFRKVAEGDVTMQSKGNSIVEATADGDVLLRNTSGDLVQLHDETRILTQQSLQIHMFTEASRVLSGVVMRDIRKTDAKLVDEGTLVDRISDPEYDQLLDSIGRNPTLPTMHLARGDFDRNPSFAEVRETVYEFAESFHVDNEVEFKGREYQPPSTEGRKSTRSNVLSPNRNDVMETIKGTLVDVNGDVLDLNRTPIQFAEDDEKADLLTKLRRSIVFHMGFNSRKDGVSLRDPLRDSRLFIDADKEGQIKINIPASSRFGNIPRYVDSEYDDSDPKTDQELDERELTASVIEQDGGQIYHNIINTCRQVFYAGTDVENELSFLNTFTTFTPSSSVSVESPPVSNINDSSYKSEGHSLHLKLDGAWITSVGSNAQDNLSWLLDTSGKIVHHVGCDEEGRSLIADYEGSVRIHVSRSGMDIDPVQPSKRLKETGFDILAEDNGESVPFISELGGPDNSAKIKTEGSVELFLGADSNDIKSLLLQSEGLVALNLGSNGFHSLVVDTEGAVALSLGTDNNANSLVLQSEGTVAFNIGGGSSSIDGTENKNPGKFDLRVEGTVGGTADTGAQRFVVDGNGITLSADGNITLDTRGDQGAGQIVAVAQKEIYLEAKSAGITLKAAGLSNEAAGIVLDAPMGVILRSGPNYIQVSPAGIIISSIPVISPPSSPDTSPPSGEVTGTVER